MKQKEVEEKIGYTFRNKDLLNLAFIHRSYWNENRELVIGHNERLEFLGDSVLGLMVAEYLYQKLSTTPEGILSDLRANLVEASSCVLYVKKLALGDYILLGKGEQTNVGKGRDSILADLFEAVVGAIYLDGGYEPVQAFFFNKFADEIKGILEKPTRNWKAELQEFSQREFQQTPSYKVVEESGPSHRKFFKVAVFVGEKKVGEGEGSSKKEAQTKAAANALLNQGG